MQSINKKGVRTRTDMAPVVKPYKAASGLGINIIKFVFFCDIRTWLMLSLYTFKINNHNELNPIEILFKYVYT